LHRRVLLEHGTRLKQLKRIGRETGNALVQHRHKRRWSLVLLARFTPLVGELLQKIRIALRGTNAPVEITLFDLASMLPNHGEHDVTRRTRLRAEKTRCGTVFTD